MKSLWVTLSLALAILPGSAMAVGSIIVSDAWTRALTMQDGTAVIFLTITDIGDPDRLIGASSPIAARGDLRETAIVNGVVHADPITSLPVTSDQPTELIPGGKQIILLTGMQERLEEGKHFPLTLVFQKAGQVQTMVLVRAANYADPLAMMK
jgi:copper(I)-binding protein